MMFEDGPDSDARLGEPPHTEPATHTVLTHLREKIVTGQFPPETRLRAEALAADMNVSRTPVRSALAVLSAEGLVSYGVNRGYTVRAMGIGDVFDSIDVRAELEGLAARQSVDHGWPREALGELAGLVRSGRAIVEAGKWSEAIELDWYRINRLIHRSIMLAAQNTVLRNAVRMTLIYPLFGDPARLCPSVAQHIPQRLRQVPDTPPEFIRASQAAHEAILVAIEAGDSEAAGRLLSEHIRATKIRLHAIATRR